jgi:hypothetical protein
MASEDRRLASACLVAISGHDQRVVGLEEARLQLTVGDHSVAVAGNPRHGRALYADDHDLRFASKVIESAREGDAVEDGRPAPDVVAAGFLTSPSTDTLRL